MSYLVDTIQSVWVPEHGAVWGFFFFPGCRMIDESQQVKQENPSFFEDNLWCL